MNNIVNMQVATPEIFIFSMACLILMIDLYTHKRIPMLSYWLTQVSLIGGIYLGLAGLSTDPVSTFNGMFIHDSMSVIVKLAILSFTAIGLVYTRQYILDRGMYRGEYFVLILIAVLGMMVMASASHFLSLYLGLELLSLSLYTLVALNRDSDTAVEAAMKYFVLGAVASGMLLYGMSLMYGVTGSLDIATISAAIQGMQTDDVMLMLGLVFIVVGLGFKLGVVPFHMWIPDIYQGAPTSVVLFIATAPKLAAFAMIIRLLVDGFQDLYVNWSEMLTILAVLSMALGNIVAITQTNFKRMLAYSAISHMGYFLLGIISATPNGYSASLFYMMIYAFTGLAAFGLIMLMSRKGFEAENISDYRGLNKEHPWYAFMIALVMFSMAGLPPTVGFYAKLSVIQALVDVQMIWLAVVAVLLAVIGAFYYLRVVKTMYFDPPERARAITTGMDMRVLVSANALALLAIMPWIGVIMDICMSAIKSMG
ncbi:MAG TPA: NADH-quinone oxidoreductase subunit NuoN [Gammaproteobacteria bacterium]|nr:NADH-quinone oxidoreductase subunit NuoN [Gammaproteobacteria bacterium]